MRALIPGAILFIIIQACSSPDEKKGIEKRSTEDTAVMIAGTMRDVMWRGKLEPIISLDTINLTNNLYGIGPEDYLKGEILINDGNVYVSRVKSDGSMEVIKTDKIGAPFFVYGSVSKWRDINLDNNIATLNDLEGFMDSIARSVNVPFAFKLSGQVKSAKIHIQNLAPGTNVTSPEEAHSGQTNYMLSDEEVEIIGFFSRNHKGVFTHHDSNMHMHLITKDEKKMGHLDELEILDMVLRVPAAIFE